MYSTLKHTTSARISRFFSTEKDSLFLFRRQASEWNSAARCPDRSATKRLAANQTVLFRNTQLIFCNSPKIKNQEFVHPWYWLSPFWKPFFARLPRAKRCLVSVSIQQLDHVAPPSKQRIADHVSCCVIRVRGQHEIDTSAFVLFSLQASWVRRGKSVSGTHWGSLKAGDRYLTSVFCSLFERIN